MTAIKKLFVRCLILFSTSLAATGLSAASGNDTCRGWGSGEDSIHALQQYSLYLEYFKQGNYADALAPWRFLYLNHPGALKRVYTDGVVLIEDLIRKEKDPALKEKYTDTLMMIYDRRIRCFGEEGFVLGRKAFHMSHYRNADMKAVLDLFARSVELQGNRSEAFVLPAYMAAAKACFDKKLITREQGLVIFGAISGIAAASKYQDAARQMQDLLAKTGWVDNCDEAKAVFMDRYRANPGDSTLWESIFNLMRGIDGCKKDALFIDVTEKLHRKNPELQTALILARGSSQASEAQQYYLEAIELDTSQNKKAEYYLEMAANVYYEKLNDFAKARSAALKAAGIRGGWGQPYLFIGDLYAAGSKACGEQNKLDAKAVYWIAIDTYLRARNVDPSVSEVAGKKIALYSKYMPTKEDCFFNNLTGKGQPYQVGCWINETTTVRWSE